MHAFCAKCGARYAIRVHFERGCAECGSTFCRDGVCCDSSCDASNEFCALRGFEGTCVAVALPSMTASSTPTPNTTPQPTGVPCGLDTECLSTFCSDGVCCSDRCDQPDELCSVPGFEGQCLPILRTPTVTPTSTAIASATAMPIATATSSSTPTATVTRNPTLVACTGNCDAGPAVTIDELIQGVVIAIGSQPTSACPAFDADHDGAVAINELVAAVSNALYGCGVPTPTPPPTYTNSATPTVTSTATATSMATDTPIPAPTDTSTETPTQAPTGTYTLTWTSTPLPPPPTETPTIVRSGCDVGFETATTDPPFCLFRGIWNAHCGNMNLQVAFGAGNQTVTFGLINLNPRVFLGGRGRCPT